MAEYKKYLSEVFGTFILVFFGTGAVVFAGGLIGSVGIAMAFGIAIIAAAYGIGQISGAHLNPAVTLSVLIAGRIKWKESIFYIISQIVGAIIGSLFVFIIAKTAIPGGYDVAAYGLGANGFAEGTLWGALIFETIATIIFTGVILGVTSKKNTNGAYAGLAIGFTLVAIHLIGIPLTGVSVNPARSIGPALFVGGTALKQLWVFIVAPLVGGAISGIVCKCLQDK